MTILSALIVAAGLQGTLAAIAGEAGGRVGVAAVLVETGERVEIEGGEGFPMQSVFKLPVALQACTSWTKASLISPGR